MPDHSIAITNNNVLLSEYKNVKNNIKSKREDTIAPLHSEIKCADGKAIISKSDYRKLKKIKNWKYFKRFFKVK